MSIVQLIYLFFSFLISVCIGEVQVSITPGHEGVLHIDPDARVVLNCTVTGLPPGDTGNTSWHIPIPDLLRKNSVKIRREGYHSLILELSAFKIHMEGTYVCLSQHHDLFSHIKLEMKNSEWILFIYLLYQYSIFIWMLVQVFDMFTISIG